MPDPISAFDLGAVGPPRALGASVTAAGVDFCIFAKHAQRVQVLLFDGPTDPVPARVLDLDPRLHRTSYYWRVFVPGVTAGQVYAYRIHGPRDAARGHLYDGQKVLVDPYGLAVAGLEIYDRHAAAGPGDNCAHALRSVVVDPDDYDWEGDRPLHAPVGRELIYELHVGGITAAFTGGLDPALRGTFAGLTAAIPHLLDLGITAVELMPVFHFDPQDAPPGRRNVWGYSPLSWFAPHGPYSADRSPLGPVREFRDMVKALHCAGIRVILDVVYNHTAEGGQDGPVISWRGCENSAYYLLSEDRTRLVDFTGCGNTVNANHSVVRRMILDSLLHWVRHMHVDGFRFDLASALGRGEDGLPAQKAPLLWSIGSEPALAATTLIAEAWDATGLYQVGSLPGDRFAQWNGAFRDDVRRFLRCDPATIESLMARMVGSPDLFRKPDQRPWDSVNFVTSHDGFTLQDLVSYDRKHNEANGEGNRDGESRNLSWNCGVEGPTDDPAVLGLRRRQARNFLCLLLLSHGTPMLTMGDEVGHTRRGNNNPWCLDNETNRLDWAAVARQAEPLVFVKELVRLTRSLGILQRNTYWTATSPDRRGEISWHGLQPGKPDWAPTSRVLGFTLADPAFAEEVLVLLNSGKDPAPFTLPPPIGNRPWRLVVDTAGRGVIPLAQALPHEADTVTVEPHGIAVFVAAP